MFTQNERRLKKNAAGQETGLTVKRVKENANTKVEKFCASGAGRTILCCPKKYEDDDDKERMMMTETKMMTRKRRKSSREFK